jgi:hypothetical protein
MHANAPHLVGSERRVLKRTLPPAVHAVKTGDDNYTTAAKVQKVMFTNHDHPYDVTVNAAKTVQRAAAINEAVGDHSYIKNITFAKNSSVTVETSQTSMSAEPQEPPVVGSDITNDIVETFQRSEIRRLRRQLAAEILKNRRLAYELSSCKKKLLATNMQIKKLFNNDQVEHMNGNKTFPWSADTISSSLKIRTAVGKNGYEHLRQQAGFPLPSYRSLCSNVESLQMAPGIQHDLMELLELKVKNMALIDRDCALVVDEVQLLPKIDYDNGIKRLVGYVSPQFQIDGQPPEIAVHALVYLIKGLHVPYKQTVAWFATGRSTVGQLWNVTKTVIDALHSRSVMVRVVTSDMGTSNIGMWRAAGLNINIDSEQCFVQHPCDESSKLYFMPDVPHVVKCMRNCLETQLLLLPKDTVEKFKLPCRDVSMQPVEEIIKIQESFEVKLVKGLSRANVHPGQYGKMKVGNAMKVFSHTTAMTMKDLVNDNVLNVRALSTAWFLDRVNNWFDIMSNNSYQLALYSSPTSSNGSSTLSGRNIQTIRDMHDLISQMDVVGARGFNMTLKPWQKGIMLASKVVLLLHQDLVVNGNYKCLVTRRLTQDALENLFSQIRGIGDSHPSVVQFRQHLKLITLSQITDVPKCSSYDIDNMPNLIAFIRSHKSKPNVDYWEKHKIQLPFIDVDNPSSLEEKGLYYIAGWVAFKLSFIVKECTTCLVHLCSDSPSLPQSSLTSTLSYGGLKHPSNELFELIQHAERFFRSHDVSNRSTEDITQAMIADTSSQLSQCKEHRLLDMAVRKFYKLRVHIRARFLTEQVNLQSQYASKSAAQRTVIK